MREILSWDCTKSHISNKNTCKSLNNLINNFIQINSKVGLDKFETIIKTLLKEKNIIEIITIKKMKE